MLNQTFLLKHSIRGRSRHIYYTTKQQKQNKTEQNNTVGTYFTASKLSAFISRRISLLVRTQQLSSLISFLHLILIIFFLIFNPLPFRIISSRFLTSFYSPFSRCISFFPDYLLYQSLCSFTISLHHSIPYFSPIWNNNIAGIYALLHTSIYSLPLPLL